MTHSPRPRRRAAFAAASAAALSLAGLLVACGGAETALVLGVIGAAGGNFVIDTDGNGQRSDTENTGIVVSVADPVAALYEPEYSVTYESFSLPAIAECTGQRTGTVRRNQLDFGACFQGEFEADATLSNVTKVRRTGGAETANLLFDTFSPQLAEGIWTDIRDNNHQILFKNDSSGCELRGGALTGNAVTITLQDRNLPTATYNDVIGMTIGANSWTSGAYVGVSGLRLQGSPGTLELQRQRYTGAVTCP